VSNFLSTSSVDCSAKFVKMRLFFMKRHCKSIANSWSSLISLLVGICIVVFNLTEMTFSVCQIHLFCIIYIMETLPLEFFVLMSKVKKWHVYTSAFVS
jgi:hypothetical protein